MKQLTDKQAAALETLQAGGAGLTRAAINRLIKAGLVYCTAKLGNRISAQGRTALYEYQVAAVKAEDQAA